MGRASDGGEPVLAHTSAQGWPGVARLVLPVAAVDVGSVAEAVSRVEALTGGVPLLLLAVRSRSAALVRAEHASRAFLCHQSPSLLLQPFRCVHCLHAPWPPAAAGPAAAEHHTLQPQLAPILLLPSKPCVRGV